MKDFLHHLLLPRESNNHRPKLLHHKSLIILILSLFMVAVLLPSLHRDFPSVLGISNTISIPELLTQTNKQRQAHGLPPLKFNIDLTKAAQMKGQNMFAKNYWAHISPDGDTPWQFIKGAGYQYLYAGENLARGFSSASDVVDAWMASPSHRENMLSPNYNDVGFAVLPGQLTGSDTLLVVQMFGSKYISDSPEVTPSQGSIAEVGRLPSAAVPGQINPSTAVAAMQIQPLFDSKTITKQLSYLLLFLLIIVFIVDAIIIERKKIERLVSHNLDHIIFLTILLFAAIIIGKGLIL
jgi:hypothetical protein